MSVGWSVLQSSRHRNLTGSQVVPVGHAVLMPQKPPATPMTCSGSTSAVPGVARKATAQQNGACLILRYWLATVAARSHLRPTLHTPGVGPSHLWVSLGHTHDLQDIPTPHLFCRRERSYNGRLVDTPACCTLLDKLPNGVQCPTFYAAFQSLAFRTLLRYPASTPPFRRASAPVEHLPCTSLPSRAGWRGRRSSRCTCRWPCSPPCTPRPWCRRWA